MIDNLSVAPVHEPERQYYFMDLCKSIVLNKENEYGRKLTCHINTFGCQMNAKDSEKLLGILEEIGFVESEDEKADFVLYNTCTVRENANLKVYGRLGYLKKLKEKNPNMIIALCGCMMQESDVVEKIRKSFSFVDIIFGTHNIFQLAELLYDRFTNKSKKPTVNVWEGTTEIVEDLPQIRKYPFKAGVNIMFGCDNFCTYCIVPYVRGRERSRSSRDIVREIEKLVSEGVVEVMLLGQNVNSYGNKEEDEVSFAELLKMVDDIEGLERIRFMTSHPKDLSEELIEVMANSKKVCHQFHLPLQSGSDRLLKLMNRHYTKEKYLSLVDKLREAMPDISITTDIIVGFPGETEEDFMETMDVVEKVNYDSAFTFIYSKRTGTPAAKMEDQIPEDVIKDRFDRLLEKIQKGSDLKTKQLVGQTKKVLVEGVNEHDDSLVTGRLDNNSVVHLKGDESLIGKIVDVHLDEAKGFYYYGTIRTGNECEC